MKPRIKQASVQRSLSQLATTVLALALVFILLRVGAKVENGQSVGAIALTGGAVAEAALAIAWWQRRGSRPGRVYGALAGVAGLVVWMLADNTMGVPMFAVATFIVVIEFGMRAGAAHGGAMFIGVAALYFAADEQPFGGFVGNFILIAGVIAAGLASDSLIAQLDRAITLEAEAAIARREEALAEMDRVLAQERMDNARLLHDELGQRLTVIGMGLDLATRMRGRGPADSPDSEAWAEVERTRSEAADALTELRTLVRSMSPLRADDVTTLDLDAALESMTRTFAGTGLDVSLKLDDGDTHGGRLDPLAYRVIQEGLTNVVRHSGARSVDVVIGAGERRTIRIYDDGGAVPGDAAEGFGLAHLRSRVEAAGGELKAAAGDRGFELEVEYPLEGQLQ